MGLPKTYNSDFLENLFEKQAVYIKIKRIAPK